MRNFHSGNNRTDQTCSDLVKLSKKTQPMFLSKKCKPMTGVSVTNYHNRPQWGHTGPSLGEWHLSTVPKTLHAKWGPAL